MGKRTKDKSEDEIKRKIRRLERELNARKESSPISHQNEDCEWESYRSSRCNYQEEGEFDTYSVEIDGDNLLPDSPVPMPVDSDAHRTSLPPGETTEESNQILEGNNVSSVVIPCVPSAQTEEDVIPNEIMEVLGEAKKSEETFGKKIPQGVSERLGKILIEGLAKEQKENLLTKILIIPENFQIVKAPKLNREVASVLNDPAKNRDKRLEKLQNQLGSGIAGLVNLTTELINNDLEKMTIIRKISEVNQVLLDLHYEETLGRRRLIIPMLDKSFINVIQNVKRDQFLFGDNLGDNIKTTKSIERSSLQIKKSTLSMQPSTSRKPVGQSGNLRAPARHVSGPGPAHAQPSTSRYYPPPPPPPPARRQPPVTRRAPPPPPVRQPPPARGYLQDYRNRRR